MKKMESANRIAMIIGIIGTVSGIYLAITGAEFSEYFSGIFLGITLFGSAYFNQKELKNQK